MNNRALYFCERDHELDQLVALFNEVDSGSGPKIAVIAGERGTGKTRLALELYRRLSLATSQSYWPDADSIISDVLELNPPLDRCQFAESMPFLWWGIRAPDPDIRGRVIGDAVADHHVYLAHHFVPLMVNARRKEAGLSLAKIWAEFGVETVASLLQIDTVLSIGEKLLESVRILRAQVDTSDIAAGIEKATVARTTAILDDFSKVFAKRKKGSVTVPLVVVLDDAQFAHLDPSLMGLITELLKRAEKEQWPLLVIATHWQRELQLDGESTGKFAGLVHSLSESWGKDRTIRLMSLQNMSAALLDQLPGLTPIQVQQILDRAGGNPRFLEQIIALSKERVSYFADRNRSGALSDRGLDALLERSVDIERVVEERLFGAPESVRESLACASSQGMRFSHSLNEVVAEALLGSSGKEGINEARDPYALVIEGPGHDGFFGTFSEKLFYRAILEVREELPKFPEGGIAFDNALRTSLLEVIANRSSLQNYDSNYPLAFLFELAINLFDRDTPSDRKVLCESLAALASSDYGKGNFERMQLSLNRVATLCREEPTGDYLGALVLVFSISPWLAESTMESNFTAYKDWLCSCSISDADSINAFLVTALEQGWSGYISSAKGDAEQSAMCFSLCLDALENAYKANPSADVKIVIANAYFNMGGKIEITSQGPVVNAPRIEVGLEIARDLHVQFGSLISAMFLLRGILAFLETRVYESSDLEQLRLILTEARAVLVQLADRPKVAGPCALPFDVSESKILAAEGKRLEAETLMSSAFDRMEVMLNDDTLQISVSVQLSLCATRMQNVLALIHADQSVPKRSIERMRVNLDLIPNDKLVVAQDQTLRASNHMMFAAYDLECEDPGRSLAECHAGLEILSFADNTTLFETVNIATRDGLLTVLVNALEALGDHTKAFDVRLEILALHETKWRAFGEFGSIKCHVERLDRLHDAQEAAFQLNLTTKGHELYIEMMEVMLNVVNKKNAERCKPRIVKALEFCELASSDGNQHLCVEYLQRIAQISIGIFHFSQKKQDQFDDALIQRRYAKELLSLNRLEEANAPLVSATHYFIGLVQDNHDHIEEAIKCAELLIELRARQGSDNDVAKMRDLLGEWSAG